MDRYREDIVAAGILRLPSGGPLAFALSCAERLYPNYVAFQREYGWGDAKSLRDALDLGWGVLEDRSIDSATVQHALLRVEAAEPETEDFEGALVSAALDAAAAAGLVLTFLQEGTLSSVEEIATLCRDTVYMFVRYLESLNPSDPSFEKRITEHPLMQTELRRQQDDLKVLVGLTDIRTNLGALQAKWRNPTWSNFGQFA